MSQSWVRVHHDNPHQLKAVVFMGASASANDTIRSNAIFPRAIRRSLWSRAGNHRAWADDIALDRLLPILKQHVLAQGRPRACALVDSVSRPDQQRHDSARTPSPMPPAAWQNDPHVMRKLQPSPGSGTPHRAAGRHHSRIVKHQSRYIKRAPTHDCYRPIFRPPLPEDPA